jgi:hypothetical protein
MPSPTLLSVLALAIAAPSLAVANPPGRPGWSFPSPASWSWGGGGWGKPPGAPAWAPVPPTPTACVTDAQATVIANQFAQLISNYSVALADAVLAENYFDQADSVNTLIDGGTEMPLAVCVVFVLMFSPFGLSVANANANTISSAHPPLPQKPHSSLVKAASRMSRLRFCRFGIRATRCCCGG